MAKPSDTRPADQAHVSSKPSQPNEPAEPPADPRDVATAQQHSAEDQSDAERFTGVKRRFPDPSSTYCSDLRCRDIRDLDNLGHKRVRREFELPSRSADAPPLIPRPDNVNKSGWNLCRAIGLDPNVKAEKEQYNSMRTYVRNLVNDTMDFTKTFSQQRSIGYICREAALEFPRLADFEDSWATKEIARVALGNKRKRIIGPTRTRSKSTKRVGASSGPHPSRDVDAGGDSAGDACSDDGVTSAASDVERASPPRRMEGRLYPSPDC